MDIYNVGYIVYCGRKMSSLKDGNVGKETKGSIRIHYFDMQPNKKNLM